MMSIYDPEKEEKETWTREEVRSLVQFAFVRWRKNKYISVFLASLIAPVITLWCLSKNDHPLVYLIGAIALVATFYVLDSTYDFIQFPIEEEENDENE